MYLNVENCSRIAVFHMLDEQRALDKATGLDLALQHAWVYTHIYMYIIYCFFFLLFSCHWKGSKYESTQMELSSNQKSKMYLFHIVIVCYWRVEMHEHGSQQEEHLP